MLVAFVLCWRMVADIDRSYEDVLIYDSAEDHGLIYSEERHFQIEQGASEHEWIISYRPPHGFNGFYLVFTLFIWFPYLIWFAPKKDSRMESEIELEARLEWVQKHRLYDRYISENEERQYIYKEETVPKFIDWLLRVEAAEAEQSHSK